MDRRMAQTIIAQYDASGDGMLQYDEFKRLVGHLTDDESLQA